MRNLKNGKRGIISYILVYVMVSVLIFLFGKVFSRKEINVLRACVANRKPKNWMKGGLLMSLKRFFSSAVIIDFSVEDAYLRGSMKQGSLFDKNRMRELEYRNFSLLMMGMPTAENAIIGKLGKIPAMGLRNAWALEFIDKSAVSTWVAVLPAVILNLRNLAGFFNLAVGADKKAKWTPLYAALQSLLADFQGVANLDHINSIAILESGGFSIKQVGGKGKNKFTVANTDISGTVALTGPTKKGRIGHDWWISLDGITFVRLTPSINAEISVSGLVSGKKYWFQHQMFDKTGLVGPLETLFIPVT